MFLRPENLVSPKKYSNQSLWVWLLTMMHFCRNICSIWGDQTDAQYHVHYTNRHSALLLHGYTATIKVGLCYCNYAAKPQIAEEIIQNLSFSSSLHPVYLIWVPAHIGITGNEIADYLAKRGASGTSSSNNMRIYSPSQSFLNSVNYIGAVTYLI